MSPLSLLASLRAFDATARAGSMSAAARRMGLQQPTLSAQITRLERDHGVELFHRRGRQLVLTPFGELLREHTQRLCRAEDDIQSLLVAVKGQFEGRLQLHAIGPYNLTPLLKRFRAERPGVQVRVGVGDSRQITARILDHDGDLGLVLQAVDHADLACLPYRRQALVVFASHEHPLAVQPSVSLEQLHGQEFVLREEGSGTRRVFEQALEARGLRVRCRLEMGSREAVREAVAQGLGLGIVADTAYVPDHRLVRLPLSGVVLATHAHLICRRDRQVMPLVASFLSLAQQMAEPA